MNFTVFGRPIEQATVRDLLDAYAETRDRIRADPRDALQWAMREALVAEFERRTAQ